MLRGDAPPHSNYAICFTISSFLHHHALHDIGQIQFFIFIAIEPILFAVSFKSCICISNVYIVCVAVTELSMYSP